MFVKANEMFSLEDFDISINIIRAFQLSPSLRRDGGNRLGNRI